MKFKESFKEFFEKYKVYREKQDVTFSGIQMKLSFGWPFYNELEYIKSKLSESNYYTTSDFDRFSEEVSNFIDQISEHGSKPSLLILGSDVII